jgi:hypothetical protein
MLLALREVYLSNSCLTVGFDLGANSLFLSPTFWCPISEFFDLIILGAALLSVTIFFPLVDSI